MFEEPNHQHQQQPVQPKWSDMLKLHDQVQTSREDFERHFGKQQQHRYKEELDQLIKKQLLQKEEQKKQDELTREKYRRELEDFKEKERMNQLKLRQEAQERAEQSLRESQDKAKREKMLREQEKQFHQHQFQELAAEDKSKRFHQKEIKIAASHDLQQTYEKEQKLKSVDTQKAKEIDKHYAESYEQLMESQEANRRQFLERAKQGIRNKEDFLNYYKKIFEEDARKKNEVDRNIIEKGMLEQMKRDQELQRQNYIQKEQMRHVTVDVLKQQIQYRKENEKLQRELEIQAENQQFLRNKQEFEHDEQLKRQKQEFLRQQTRNVWEKQMEEHHMNRVKENVLSPVEERLNRSDVDVIKYGLSPSTQVSAPSFVPGRSLPFERQTQIQYMNKALHVDGKKPISLHNPANASEIQLSANEPSSQQPKLVTQPETMKHMNEKNNQILQKASPLTVNPTYNPAIKFQSQTPLQIRSKQDNQSIQNYQIPDWRKDYLYVKNKNGPYSNPLNIITNDYKYKPSFF